MFFRGSSIRIYRIPKAHSWTDWSQQSWQKPKAKGETERDSKVCLVSRGKVKSVSQRGAGKIGKQHLL